MTRQTLPNSDIWMVRAGHGGIDHFLERKVVAIGFDIKDEVLPTDSDDDIRSRYPDIGTNALSQIGRFVREMATGDAVITYDSGKRIYHIGIIQSPAEWSDDSAGHIRRVEWVHQLSRDALSPDAQQRLTSLLTVFRLRTTTSQEFRLHCLGENETASNSDEPGVSSYESDGEEILDTADILQEYIEKSDQFVEDQIAKLDWQELQRLVAGILRSMGYRTKVSIPGPDRGVDIFASPDGLGLSEPRIFVEVKHRAGAVGSQAIRTFTGGRQDSDRCLYVSTGGFSKDARYEADRSRVPLTLLAMPDLRELLVSHYEALDSETRALVPLQRVYWPVAD